LPVATGTAHVSPRLSIGAGKRVEITDYALPDINGIEATRRLKSVAQFVEIPVVMITGNSEKAVVVESLKAGAADFIVKPLDRDRLLAKIRGLLR
jgi:DNA-binding response OmpR family regulator